MVHTVLAMMTAAVLIFAADPVKTAVEGAPTAAQIIEKPKWKYLPGNEELSCYFPQRALSLGRTSGEAALDCVVDDRGWLHDCKTVQESPAKLSFGAAASAVATKILVLEPADGDGQPVAGRRVAVTLKFNFKEAGSCARFAKNQHAGG